MLLPPRGEEPGPRRPASMWVAARGEEGVRVFSKSVRREVGWLAILSFRTPTVGAVEVEVDDETEMGGEDEGSGVP